MMSLDVPGSPKQPKAAPSSIKPLHSACRSLYVAAVRAGLVFRAYEAIYLC